MRDFRRTRILVLTLLAGLVLFGTTSASAGTNDPIIASVACCTFSPTNYNQDQGSTAVFDNPIGGAMHNVTSFDTGPDGKVLFESATINADESAPVKGTQYLKAGTYKFYCTIHGPSMKGVLVVDKSGTAAPRPSVRPKVLGQPLKKVLRTGKLKVKVKTGVTAASGVTLTALKGKKKLGRKGGLKFGAMKKSTVTLKLTKAGKKVLRKKKKVLISVKAAVRYGKTVASKRKLH